MLVASAPQFAATSPFSRELFQSVLLCGRWRADSCGGRESDIPSRRGCPSRPVLPSDAGRGALGVFPRRSTASRGSHHHREVEMTSPLRWLRVPLPAAVAVALSLAGAPVAVAQGTGTIRGTVTDAVTNRPVDGAQILILGTSLTTISNAAGQFQLGVPEGQITLRVRRVGYASATRAVTVTAGADSVADFALSQAAIGLDAVVVTGTGTETEVKKLGNTVVQIDVTALRNAPVANLSEQLAARDPSVSILPSGGLAGEG